MHIAVEEGNHLVVDGETLLHQCLKLFEHTAVGAEAEVHPFAVGRQEAVHRCLVAHDTEVQIRAVDILEEEWQGHGIEVDVLLLVEVPVEFGHHHLVDLSGLDVERLAVAFNLDEHQTGIVGVAMQLESAVVAGHRAVQRHLFLGQHIAVATEPHMLPGAVGHRAPYRHIGLSHSGQRHNHQHTKDGKTVQRSIGIHSVVLYVYINKTYFITPIPDIYCIAPKKIFPQCPEGFLPGRARVHTMERNALPHPSSRRREGRGGEKREKT